MTTVSLVLFLGLTTCFVCPQVHLINAVSASLIRAPNFKNKDDVVRRQLLHLADRVSDYDSEFILKVADIYRFMAG